MSSGVLQMFVELGNLHLKNAGGHIGRNVVEITIKMKTIVRKPLMIKIIKLCLRNLDNRKILHKDVYFVNSYKTDTCKKLLVMFYCV